MIRNEHHVIPQAMGGTDGPVVSLDSAHHDLLHLKADKILSRQPYDHLIKGFSKSSLERLMYLATRVVVATQTMRDDPNKRIPVHFSLSKTDSANLSALLKFHKLSKEKFFTELIRRAYTSTFQPSNPSRS